MKGWHAIRAAGPNDCMGADSGRGASGRTVGGGGGGGERASEGFQVGRISWPVI